MPPDVVADLITRGRDARASRSPVDGGIAGRFGRAGSPGPELIKVAGGELVRMDEIGVGTRCTVPTTTTPIPARSHSRSRAGPDRHPLLGLQGQRSGRRPSATTTISSAFDRIFDELRAESVRSDWKQRASTASFRRRRDSVGTGKPVPAALHLRARHHPGEEPEGVRQDRGSEALPARHQGGAFPGFNMSRKDRTKSVLLIGHRQS